MTQPVNQSWKDVITGESMRSPTDSWGSTMEKGDHLISARSGYSHHGLYLGRNKVIHYSGSSGLTLQNGTIEIVELEIFCQGNGYTVQTYPFRIYDHKNSIDRAKSRLGEDWYSILRYSCEIFVRWCIIGTHSSETIDKLIHGFAISSELHQKLRPLPEVLLVASTTKNILDIHTFSDIPCQQTCEIMK